MSEETINEETINYETLTDEFLNAGINHNRDNSLEYHVEPDEAGTRIDKYLSEKNDQLSRSYIQKLIEDAQILVNDRVIKSNYKIRSNDLITLIMPNLSDPDIMPENIPLEILYEDEDILIVNKPKDMVVHPSVGHYTGTLVNAIMYHCKDQLSGINGVMRPGIVHRIDKDTTGVLVICKNDNSHRNLAEQFKVHSITRRYRAIVAGNFREETGTISTLIGRHPTDRKKMSVNCKNGKEAVTHFRVLEQFPNYSYIECWLETGRTHQIRVHMSSIGHPLVGDEVYGNGKNPFHLQGQALHAMVLGFQHPSTNTYVEFSAEPPEYFETLLKKLRK